MVQSFKPQQTLTMAPGLDWLACGLATHLPTKRWLGTCLLSNRLDLSCCTLELTVIAALQREHGCKRCWTCCVQTPRRDHENSRVVAARKRSPFQRTRPGTAQVLEQVSNARGSSSTCARYHQMPISFFVKFWADLPLIFTTHCVARASLFATLVLKEEN